MTDPTERRRLHPEVEMVLQAIQSRNDAMTSATKRKAGDNEPRR
jgi:hypothetical protein